MRGNGKTKPMIGKSWTYKNEKRKANKPAHRNAICLAYFSEMKWIFLMNL